MSIITCIRSVVTLNNFGTLVTSKVIPTMSGGFDFLNLSNSNTISKLELKKKMHRKTRIHVSGSLFSSLKFFSITSMHRKAAYEYSELFSEKYNVEVNSY